MDIVTLILPNLWIYKYYIIGGLIVCTVISLFISIFFLQKKVKSTRIIKRDNLRNNILTWKYAYTFMRNNYKTDNRLRRAKFYCRNIILLLLIFALCFFIYENYTSVVIYIGYLQYMYIGGIIFEYLLLYSAINIDVHHNYNNINNEKTCILIPFGGSTLENRLSYIGDTMQRASRLVDSRSVYLLHNGSDLCPKLYDKIKKICDDNNTTYVYVPQPNKSYAIYYAAKYLCGGYDQAMIIDDDVPLNDDTYIPTMNTEVGAYLITSYVDDKMSPYVKTLAELQGTEYLLSGMTKIAQSRWNLSASALSHHGAVGLWKIKELVFVMSKHNTIFHGEDLMMGILAYLSNFRLKVVEGVFVRTKVPDKLFGNGGLIKQRIYSWDYIVLKFVGTYFRILFHGSLFEHMMLKIFVAYELWTLFIDIQRIPLILWMVINNPLNLLIFISAIYLLNLVILIWFNYVTMYDFDVKVGFGTLLLFPAYKFLLVLFRIFGELNYLIKYRSTMHRYPTLIENMPELPNILEDSGMDLHSIKWDKIYSDNSYIRESIMVSAHNTPIVRRRNTVVTEPTTNSNDQWSDVQNIFDEIIKLIDQEEKEFKFNKMMKKKMGAETSKFNVRHSDNNSEKLDEVIEV